MKPISLSILWHMHQPLYRLRGEQSCFMPWVRLHAIAAYHDMVRVLEEFPEMRVTFNLVPSLVEQIRDYVSGATDLFQEVAVRAAGDPDETDRSFLFEHFFSVHHERMIGAIPRYAALFEQAQQARRLRGDRDAWKEFSTADYVDLAALFDLTWFGYKAREDFPEIDALRKKGGGYTGEDIERIHSIEKTILRRVLGLYKAAQDRGQIEISCSPFAHPILPLLVDTDSAREAYQEMPLPPRFAHREDARRQVVEGLTAMEREFGVRPKGMWPSEGSLSHEVAGILAACDLKWAASDEGVLARSQRDGGNNPRHAWEVEGAPGGMALVFRDRELSDRIGFTYSRRDPREAAHDFVSAVLGRASQAEEKGCMILVALDGENPWEHYASAGGPFLRSLYGELSRNPEISCMTVGTAVSQCTHRRKIRHVHAGSWINSDFGVWIGGPEKNRAWSILGRVRAELAPHLEIPETMDEARRAAWESLRAAESSDWFWWLDGQFTSSYRAQFDEAFRGHLRKAYEALGLPSPDFLSWFIPAPKVMKNGIMGEPFEWLSPRLDGFESDLFEWHGALYLPWNALSSASTMQRSAKPIESLRLGFSRTGELLVRIDPLADREEATFRDLQVELQFRVEEKIRKVIVNLDELGNMKDAWCFADDVMNKSLARAVARKILEISIPTEEAGLAPGKPAVIKVQISSAGGEDIVLREIQIRRPETSHLTLMAGVP